MPVFKEVATGNLQLVITTIKFIVIGRFPGAAFEVHPRRCLGCCEIEIRLPRSYQEKAIVLVTQPGTNDVGLRISIFVDDIEDEARLRGLLNALTEKLPELQSEPEGHPPSKSVFDEL